MSEPRPRFLIIPEDPTEDFLVRDQEDDPKRPSPTMVCPKISIQSCVMLVTCQGMTGA